MMKQFKNMSIKERIAYLKQKLNKEKEKIKQEAKNCKLKYITGESAFNIPYKGILCDWHQIGMLVNNKYIIHPENIIGAEKIFGDYGLYNCEKFFKDNERNIQKLTNTSLCANPIRALLDILYYKIVIQNTYPLTLENFQNEFMFDEIDFNELKEKLNILESFLSKEQNILLSQWKSKNL